MSTQEILLLDVVGERIQIPNQVFRKKPESAQDLHADVSPCCEGGVLLFLKGGQ